MNEQTDYEHLRDTLGLPSDLAREWAQARTHPYECTKRLGQQTQQSVADIANTLAGWNIAQHTRRLTEEQIQHAYNLQGALFHADYTSDAPIVDSLSAIPPVHVQLSVPGMYRMLQEGQVDATADERYWKPAVRHTGNTPLEKNLLELMIRSFAGTEKMPLAPPEDMFARFHLFSIRHAHENPEAMHLATITHHQKEYCLQIIENVIAHERSQYTSSLAGRVN